MRALALVFGLLMGPSLWAADFGSPRVLSVRGEPLTVVIPMTGIRPGTETAYFPLLAPQAAFDQRGIPREAELTRLRYRVNSTGPGQAELVVTTRESWDAASLTTLIEIYSPVGALLRPVTVSIPARRDVNGQLAQPSGVEPVAPKPAAGTEAIGTESAGDSRSTTRVATETAVADAPPVQTVRVNSGMTLWRIAERVRPEGLTMEQVMMALYATNPDAFEYGNVNALEKDRVLTVPSREVMAAIDPALATLEFKAHMAQPKRDFRADATALAADRTTPVTPVLLAPEPVTRDLIAGHSTPDLSTPVGDSAPTSQSIAVVTEQPVTADVRANPPVESPVAPTRVESSREDSPSRESEAEQRVIQTLDASVPEPVPVPVEVSPEPDLPPANDGILVGRIAELESKLTAVDARISELIETITTPPPPTVTERAFDTAVTPQLQTSDPTPAWVAWLRRPEILGALAGAAFLILVLIWRTTTPAVSARPPVKATAAKKSGQPVSPERVSAVQKDPLALAIETVQHKLVEPHAQEKTESLYRLEDEEALLAAFSADALNEHPEWGDDPDDEADLASQQLEMVQSYLDRGMREVAIDLLQRVAVSPDRAARTRAQTWLSQLQTDA